MSNYPDSLDVRPLTTWPGDLTPAHRRERALFSATLSSTLTLLSRELSALGCKHPVMEIAVTDPADWRIDGKPRANARPDHPGVVLSLPSTKVGPLRYATDTFTTWQDNLRAIALGMEALRKVDRYGITKRGEQYTGFRALPPGSGGASGMTSDEAARILLNFTGEAQWPMRPDERTRLVRAAKGKAHPDRNEGDRSAWDQVEAAEQVLVRAGAL